MRFNLRKLYKSVSLSLLIVASWAGIAHAATQDVRVTNFPTSYSVVNTTWDSRLSTLQTTLQTLSADMSQFPTFVSRFGWNGTMSFSQGFELLYNDVHSLATASSQSDILTAFNREYPSGQPNSGTSTKRYLYRAMGAVETVRGYLNGTDSGSLITSLDNNIQHIDSDLHSIDTNVNYISTDVYGILGKETSIDGKMTVNNDRLQSIYSEVAYQSVQWTPKLANIESDLNILQEFFADPDTVAQKAAADAASDSALNNFTGNGQSSASATDYADIDWAFSDVKGSLGTGSVSALDAPSIITGSDQNAWAWFSQATYDSINPAPTRGGLLNAETYMAFYDEQSASNTRKGSSYTPLLDGYYKDINKAVGK